MSKPTVLLLESVTDQAMNLLSDATDVIVAPAPDRGIEVISGHTIDAIVTRGKGQVNPQLIDACQGLSVIARCGVGLDNIAVSHASSRSIKVINAPGSNADTVAEHTLALMLTAQRKIVESTQSVRAGEWDDRKSYDGDEIRSKTLGIIGMGDIGQRVARLATAFGMEVQYWNRSYVDLPYPQRELSDVLHNSDIISIHVALTDQTSGMITADDFNKNRPPILINTARGGIISDDEIIRALESGRLRGFAADVLATEPPDPQSPLLSMDHVYITPHSASLTALTYNEMCVMTVQNLIKLLNGKSIGEKFIFNRKDL